MSTKGKKGWIIAFVLPCVVLFCLVYAIPFIMVITTSFCNYTLTQAPAFQGLENFKIIFADRDCFHIEYVQTIFSHNLTFRSFHDVFIIITSGIFPEVPPLY